MGGDLFDILGPALTIAVTVALVHAPLGIEVLRRGIVFIDLAIAQIAGLVIVLVNLVLHDPAWALVQAMAVAASVLAALFFRWIERTAAREQEAVIGASFIAAAALTLLALANHPHGGEEIQHVLSGQVLFVTWTDVLQTVPAFALILAPWLRVPALRQGLAFYILFAITVTLSVQLVGVYVVFATLILPALGAGGGAGRPLGLAWASAVLAIGLGLGGGYALDLPIGPALVVALTLSAVAFRLGRRLGVGARTREGG